MSLFSDIINTIQRFTAPQNTFLPPSQIPQKADMSSVDRTMYGTPNAQGYAGTPGGNQGLYNAGQPSQINQNLQRAGIGNMKIAPPPAPASGPRPDSELEQLAKTDRNPVQETRYQELLRQQGQSNRPISKPMPTGPTQTTILAKPLGSTAAPLVAPNFSTPSVSASSASMGPTSARPAQNAPMGPAKGILPGIGQAVAEPFKNVATGLTNIITSPFLGQQFQQNTQALNQASQELITRAAQPGVAPDEKKRLLRLASDIAGSSGEASQQYQKEAAGVSPGTFARSALEVGSLPFSMGTGGLLREGAEALGERFGIRGAAKVAGGLVGGAGATTASSKRAEGTYDSTTRKLTTPGGQPTTMATPQNLGGNLMGNQAQQAIDSVASGQAKVSDIAPGIATVEAPGLIAKSMNKAIKAGDMEAVSRLTDLHQAVQTQMDFINRIGRVVAAISAGFGTQNAPGITEARTPMVEQGIGQALTSAPVAPQVGGAPGREVQMFTPTLPTAPVEQNRPEIYPWMGR